MVVFVLLLIAVILLVLAALNVPSPRLNLMCLGLAVFAASFLYNAGKALT